MTASSPRYRVMGANLAIPREDRPDVSADLGALAWQVGLAINERILGEQITNAANPAAVSGRGEK